jgi:hypothetical protein
MPNERRLRKRVNLSVYLAAVDAANLQLLGRIVDINAAGFLLLTEEKLDLGHEYSVNITLPEAIQEKSLVNCIAIVRRVTDSANPSFFEIGFDISYASSETKTIIEKIQEKWHLNFPNKN